MFCSVNESYIKSTMRIKQKFISLIFVDSCESILSVFVQNSKTKGDFTQDSQGTLQDTFS